MFNYLKDEEALFALGLLTEGAKGKGIAEAAFPSLITAGTTSAMFQKNDSAKLKSDNLQKLLESDKVSDLDKLYISAGVTPPKNAKVGKRTVSDEVLKVYDKVKLFTPENFNDEFGKLSKAEQSIYKNKIEGNVDAIQAAVADKIQKSVTLEPNQLIITSSYKLTDDAGDSFDHDSRSFRRGGWWQYAVDEAKSIREGVGLIDASAFTKHVVKGPGATQFLDWFTCNKLPKIGRINLTYALTSHGTTRTEYTIVRNGENDYYLVSAGAWTAYDADYLRKAAEDKSNEFGYIEIQDVTTQWGVFAIAGPKTRNVLSKVIKDSDPTTVLSNKRFPWLSARQIELGMCPVNAIRVAYTGELGWELHHPIEMQNYLFDLLMKAGADVGMKLVGGRAQNWLRQEKSYRAFGTELGRDATPQEADLPRFIDLEKNFFGKNAMLKTGIRSKCVTLLIDGPNDADPWGREALYNGDIKVGRLTSGGYSVVFKKSIGMGYVKPEFSNVGQRLMINILGERYACEVVEDSPYDPKNKTIRIDC